MGYKCSFMDNETYSAQDVNERFSSFLTSGVALSDSGNVLADINEVSANITNSGVGFDSCKVVCQDGVYKISKGSCFMEDGSSIIFDSEGYQLQVTPYVHQYVYLKRNEPENTIDIMVTTDEPEGSCVRLAEITASGDVHDRRQYAKLKVKTSQTGSVNAVYREYYAAENYASEPDDIGTSNISYLIIWYGYFGLDDDYVELDTLGRCICVIDDFFDRKFTMVDASGRTRFVITFRKDGPLIKTSIESSDNKVDCAIGFGVF